MEKRRDETIGVLWRWIVSSDCFRRRTRRNAVNLTGRSGIAEHSTFTIFPVVHAAFRRTRRNPFPGTTPSFHVRLPARRDRSATGISRSCTFGLVPHKSVYFARRQRDEPNASRRPQISRPIKWRGLCWSRARALYYVTRTWSTFPLGLRQQQKPSGEGEGELTLARTTCVSCIRAHVRTHIDPKRSWRTAAARRVDGRGAHKGRLLFYPSRLPRRRSVRNP